jgi:hypothetical protein
MINENGVNDMSLSRSMAVGVVLLMLVMGVAQATPISVSDWHLTTDGFGGLKQSQLSEDVYFAVSRSNVFDDTNTYEMLDGYHWASSEEYISLIGETISTNYAYYGQGGWSQYEWEGLTRYQFFFSDTETTDRIQHVGNFEYATWVRDITSYHSGYGNNFFAGFVLVKDASQVPGPASIALMGLGLVGLGFARRKKAA